MLIQVLKSKLNVTVTGAKKDYKGSITIDPELCVKAGLYYNERVEVNARDHDARISTYVIPAFEREGSGCVEMNGGAAQFFKPGDKIHINSFGIIEMGEDILHEVVDTDENNQIIEK